MPANENICRAIILIKAIPRASKKYQETVCCAGVTDQGDWKRLYPLRFRQLDGENQFSRWDIVSFRYRRPTSDHRKERCHVFEDTLNVIGSFDSSRRAELIEKILRPSARAAAEAGESLAAIKPKEVKFIYKKRKDVDIESQRKLFQQAARQGSFIDKDLAAIEPSPYSFAFHFIDDNGSHTYQCGDWETQATFFNWRKKYGEDGALSRLSQKYNDEYVSKGVVFALGNVQKRPHVWQLLGVIRVDPLRQLSLIL